MTLPAFDCVFRKSFRSRAISLAEFKGLIQQGSMVGFAYPLGLISINGYVSPNKEFHWLASALVGMILCKIVSTNLLASVFSWFESLS